MIERFYRHWVVGTAIALVLLCLYAPFALAGHDPSIALIFCCGPAYMLHQIEEHAGDRFRLFVNAQIFGGLDVLTPLAVLWINLPGVWGVNLLALYAAVWIAPGWGLAAPWLAVVNALAHLAAATRFRGYNPGLASAIAVFLPLGVLTLLRTPASMAQNLFGLAMALAVHAAIIAPAARRLKFLRNGQA